MIQPEVPEGTQASIFAIFDEAKKLQFVGFSKDLRNSLRTVFSRRPDKAFFYKCALLLTPYGFDTLTIFDNQRILVRSVCQFRLWV